MRYAIIESGKVVNIVEAETEFAAKQGWIDAVTGKIGDLWDGVKFTTPIPDPAIALREKRETMVVTPWQISKALLAVGLLDDVEAAVAGADRVVQLGWMRAQEFKRLDPLVVTLGAAVGKSDTELDSIFELAMTL